VLRFVRFGRAVDYLRLGWMVTTSLADCYHGDYAVLMEWPCQCPVVEPF
jgi:hypothetical protein